MNSHDQYGQLCVLAVAGQLTGKKFAEFESHRERCSVCQQQMLALIELSVRLSAHGRRSRRSATSKRMQDRFRVRAIRQGIPLRSEPAVRPASRFLRVGLMTVGLAVAILVLRWKPTHFETSMANTNNSGAGIAGSERAASAPESDNPDSAKGELQQVALWRQTSSPRLKFVATKPHTSRMRQNSGPQRSAWTLRFMLSPSLFSDSRVQDSITAYRPGHGSQLALRENPKCSAWTVEGDRVSAPWERACTQDEKPTFHYDASVLDRHPFADSKSIMKTAAFLARFSRPSPESFQ